MVDERDDHYDNQEEGEYHFSDDQINYDMDAETSKASGSGSSSKKKTDIKALLVTQFTQHRRMVLGLAFFLVLIGVIYKMVVPASVPPVTDFANNDTVRAPAVTQTPARPTVPASPTQTAAMATAGMVTAPNQPVPPTAPTAQPSLPAQTAPAVDSTSPIAAAAAQTAQPPVAEGSPDQALSPMQQAQASMTSQEDATTQPPTTEGAPKNPADRLASLEQQNAAIMNLLQTEYAQKISDYETQSTATRGKIEELTKRINRMESALTQITQLLREGNRPGVSAEGNYSANVQDVPTRNAEPKQAYSVQAIIPGRAWLKSDSGDTVTVAEGDIIRSYGKVTKIDPYDGIVNIDTGKQVITLSYGISAE